MAFLEILRAIAALAVTLGLVGLAAWAMRRYGPTTMMRLQSVGADRRLSIVETLMLDPHRRLILVRLDEEETLILIGEGQVIPTTAPRRARKPAAPKPAEETAS